MAPVFYHTGKFPPRIPTSSSFIKVLCAANVEVARYGGLLAAIPNATVLLGPLFTQEAVMSSRIEGTQATMAEVLEFEAGGKEETLEPSKRADIVEVLNYRNAVQQAASDLETLPICGRLLRNAHEVLLAGARGEDKARGRYRTIQNHIGMEGSPLDQARFVPIAPEFLEEGMKRWETYLNGCAEDPLFQMAVMHAEFESLHPFLDGDGRIGRMLIPLYLKDRKLLDKPMFYMSEYLESRRDEYCDRLLRVSERDDWEGWCTFFLEGVRWQAKGNNEKAKLMLALYQSKKEQLLAHLNSVAAIHALDFLFERPLFTSTAFVKDSQIPEATARRLLPQLRDSEGLIKEVRPGSGRRPGLYVFADLLNIAEGRKVF